MCVIARNSRKDLELSDRLRLFFLICFSFQLPSLKAPFYCVVVKVIQKTVWDHPLILDCHLSVGASVASIWRELWKRW